jgi:peroxiredoxin
VLGYDRNRLLRHSIAAAFLLVVAALFVRQQLAESGVTGGTVTLLGPRDDLSVEVGQPAPDFLLESRRADPLLLSSLQGRVVILNFWASWCGPCRQEMPEFQRAFARGEAAGAPVVVAVNVLSLDARAPAEAFVDELGVTFPVLFDATGDVAERYRVRGLPSTFFIDRDGVVRRATYGPVTGAILEEGIAAAERGADVP